MGTFTWRQVTWIVKTRFWVCITSTWPWSALFRPLCSLPLPWSWQLNATTPNEWPFQIPGRFKPVFINHYIMPLSQALQRKALEKGCGWWWVYSELCFVHFGFRQRKKVVASSHISLLRVGTTPLWEVIFEGENYFLKEINPQRTINWVRD